MRSFNQCACSVHLLIMDAEEKVLTADFVAHVRTYTKIEFILCN